MHRTEIRYSRRCEIPLRSPCAGVSEDLREIEQIPSRTKIPDCERMPTGVWRTSDPIPNTHLPTHSLKIPKEVPVRHASPTASPEQIPFPGVASDVLPQDLPAP